MYYSILHSQLLFDYHDGLIVFYSLTVGNEDAFNNSVVFGLYLVHQLHGLDYHYNVALLDCIANLYKRRFIW